MRDARLLPGDRDFRGGGRQRADMLAAGFRQVGRDFPVFLHPDTGEEHALARTERKSGRGYTGFCGACRDLVGDAEDALRRRDFTINAIARARTARWPIPGGMRDLEGQAGTSATPSSRTRCGYYARRASWPASRRWASPLLRTRWR